MCDRLQAPNKAHWKNRIPVGGNSAEADINGSHSGRLSYISRGCTVRLCYRWLRNLPAGRGPNDSFLRSPRISFVCGVDERSSLVPRILAYRSQRRPDQLAQFTLEGCRVNAASSHQGKCHVQILECLRRLWARRGAKRYDRYRPGCGVRCK